MRLIAEGRSNQEIADARFVRHRTATALRMDAYATVQCSRHGRTERSSLRRRASTALVFLGHQIGGTTPPPAVGGPGPVAG